jgi:hypothetical protein
METLDSPLTFFHALELGTRDSGNFSARGMHIVSQHHDMVDAHDIHDE